VTRPYVRAFSAVTAALVVASGVLLLGGSSASAFDAGPLASVLNANTSGTSGTNFDAVQVTAPAPCDPAATRHTLKITAVTATNPADQVEADKWVTDLLYSPSSVGLPGPITNPSNGNWQQIADAFGQLLVPGTYSFILQCQNNLGTTIFEEWSGGVTFTSPTAWTGFTGATGPAPTPTPPTPTPTPPTPTPTPTPTATATATATLPTFDTVAPTASFTGPTRSTILTSSTVVSWRGSDNVGVASFDVRYRKAAWNGQLGGFIAPSSLQATTAHSTVVALAAGSLYCFSVRARDAAGNVSGFGAQRCTARPLDDRALEASGKWAKTKGKVYYSGTVSASKAKGATLTRKGALAGRMALVASTGKGFGKVGVLYNAKLVKTVNLSAKGTHNEVVIALPRLAKAGTVQLKVLSSGKTVRVDGLLLARL
jgi:hypothetical protein